MERLKLGGERRAERTSNVEQGLDPQSITDETKPPRVDVPEREGEHASEALERGLEPQRVDGFEHDLRIRVPFPRDPEAQRVQLRADLGRVVDLSVVGHAVAAGSRPHGLPASFAEIHDGQSAMPEAEARLRIEESS
jgi:hypothetical protein